MMQTFFESLGPIPPKEAEAVFYERYDDAIVALCPDYQEMQRLLVAAIPKGVRAVVDLGCGTGTLLARIGETHPHIERLVGVDRNAALLQKAREKLCALDRFTLLERDIVRDPLPEAEVYVSSLVLHNLDLIDQIGLYHRIAHTSADFIQFESISGETPEEEEERWSYLRWWMTKVGMPASLQHMAVEHIRDHDQPMSLSQHRKLTEAEGLTFDLHSSSPGFAVFAATRRV
jgi:ubiquinone/menaquinone biosynthesis C-methylase UbiE